MTAQSMPRRGSVSLKILFLMVFMTTAGAMAQVTTNLLNINFGGGSKVGLSGTGLTTNDTWNVISGSANFTTNNLLWANATTSSVSLTFTNLPWNGSVDGVEDGMLSTYVYGVAYDFGESVVVPAIITISNLPPSTYKVYAYGSGLYPETDHESFTLTVGTNSHGTKTTSNYPFDPATEPLTEDVQYVVFTNVVVTNGQVLVLDLAGYYSHTVNGLQIIDVTPVPTLPSVTFNPGAGTTVPVSISLSVTNHTDAVIYYTLDGSTPTTSSSVYSTSLSLSNATTVKAFATKTNYLNSAVTSAFYPLPQLPNVEFNPEGDSLLPVSLVLSVPGHTNATIYYTLNGTTPTTNSSIYTGAISLTSSNWSYSGNVAPTMTSYTAPSGNTVTYSSEKSGDSGKAWKAFDKNLTGTSYWIASGTTNEWVAVQMSGPKVIGRYSISTRTNTPDGPKSWRLEGWNGSQYVTLDTREDDRQWLEGERREFVCQTNGLYSKYRLYVNSGYTASDNTTGRISIGEIELMKASVTVTAFATKSLYYNSGVSLAEYHAPAVSLPQIAPPPTFSYTTGLYTDPINVSLSSTLSGSTIEYSTDGINWQTYTNAISLQTAGLLYGRTTKSGYETSPIAAEYYTFLIPAVVISPSTRVFTNAVTVTLSNQISGSSIGYRFGTNSWQSYSSSFVISNTTLLSVSASAPGYVAQTNSTLFEIVSPDLPALGTLLNINFGTGSKTGFAAVGISTNDVWNLVTNSALSTNSALIWSSGTTSAVSVVISNLPSTYANEYGDAMLGSYLSGPTFFFDEEFNVIPIPAGIEVRDLPSGRYDLFLYAVNNNPSSETGGFRLMVGTVTNGTKYTSTFDTYEGWPALEEGKQYVVFTNVSVATGETLGVELFGGGGYILNGLQLMVQSGGPAQLPTPSVSPTNGTFTEPTTITLSNQWAGGQVRYSFDGTNWFTNSTVTLLDSATLYIQAIKGGYLGSTIVTNSFTVNLPTAMTPSVTPAGGEYPVSQLVTFYSGLSGASYRFSINGGDWSTNGTAVISTNSTVILQSFKYGYSDSAWVTNSYVINTNLEVIAGTFLNFNFGTGSKTGFAAVGVLTNDLWNLVTVTNAGTARTNPITGVVWADGTVSGLSLIITNLSESHSNGNSDTMLGSYLSQQSYDGENGYETSLHVRNLPSGIYNLYVYGMGVYPDFGERTTYYVSVNGSSEVQKWVNPNSDMFDPAASEFTEDLNYVVFTNVLVEAAQDLRIRLGAADYYQVINGLQIKRMADAVVPLPQVGPGSGNYSNIVSVVVTNVLPGVTNWVSTNGTTWTAVTGTVPVDGDTMLYAKSTKPGLLDSGVVTNTYTFHMPVTQISPSGGQFTGAATVTLTNVVGGTTIEYSIDNGTNWVTYTGSFSLDGLENGSGVVWVRSSKNGYVQSVTMSGVYYFVAAAPVYSQPTGDYTNTVSLTLSTTTSGATIEYSLTGTNWFTYTNTLTIDYDSVVYARTVKEGYIPAGHVLHQASAGFNAIQGIDLWFYKYSTQRGGEPNAAFLYFDTELLSWRQPVNGYGYIGFDYQQANTTNDVIRTFLAPYAGDVVITSSPYLTNSPVGERIRILRNQSNILGWTMVQDIGTNQPLIQATNVSQGDLLHFQLSGTNTSGSPLVLWDPTIQFVHKRTYTFDIRDRDNDGLGDALERRLGLDPELNDTDGDGIPDGEEDSDYDGVSNAQELIDGTDPGDPTSVVLYQLASFQFNAGSLLGGQGQVPLSTNGALLKPSYSSNAVFIARTNQALLSYRDQETNGNANINLANGSVRFWFKPDWGSTNAGGNGPGGTATLLSIGDPDAETPSYWGIDLNASGTEVYLRVISGTNVMNVLTGAVSLVSNTWHQIAVTYSSNSTTLYLNGAAIVTGTGITVYPDKPQRQETGLIVGNRIDGESAAAGAFDDLETFNSPLSAAAILASYETTLTQYPDINGYGTTGTDGGGGGGSSTDYLLDTLLLGFEVFTPLKD